MGSPLPRPDSALLYMGPLTGTCRMCFVPTFHSYSRRILSKSRDRVSPRIDRLIPDHLMSRSDQPVGRMSDWPASPSSVPRTYVYKLSYHLLHVICFFVPIFGVFLYECFYRPYVYEPLFARGSFTWRLVNYPACLHLSEGWVRPVQASLVVATVFFRID